ncbi:MAG TPA: YggS family pyridoxal phosphate-dependent enzyme [Vicinamibacteria bacterium]|nr:YggS family pyridoxal phosphate-dependent enzyme [Vicinamibacteria bacterium]
MTQRKGEREIAEAVAAVRERIAAAAARSGRQAGDVRLVAVSKAQPAEAVRAAFAAGVRDFGENKIQEAEGKIAELAELRLGGLAWHMVGHLQSNKARRAATLFDMVHSLDDPALGPRLEKAAAQQRKVLKALVQVDLAGEETKFGLEESRLFTALDQLRGSKSLHVVGLMVLPPYSDDPEQTRPYFQKLRALRDRALAENLLLGAELSMGMSHDFEAAIEEGATMVRVGTALFGGRPGD